MDDDIQSQRLYTIPQATVATIFGGPLAGALLLAQNYRQLGSPPQARRAVTYGSVSVVVLFVIALFWPDFVPSIALPAGYTFAFRAMAERLQGAQVRSRLEADAERYSWGRAIGVSLLALLVTAAFFFGAFSLLAGLLSP